jgi:hypothetical protein
MSLENKAASQQAAFLIDPASASACPVRHLEIGIVDRLDVPVSVGPSLSATRFRASIAPGIQTAIATGDRASRQVAGRGVPISVIWPLSNGHWCGATKREGSYCVPHVALAYRAPAHHLHQEAA